MTQVDWTISRHWKLFVLLQEILETSLGRGALRDIVSGGGHLEIALFTLEEQEQKTLPNTHGFAAKQKVYVSGGDTDNALRLDGAKANAEPMEGLEFGEKQHPREGIVSTVKKE